MMAPMNPNEYVIPAPVVAHKGIEFFDNLIRKTLSQIGASQQQVSMAGRGSPQSGYIVGGATPAEGGRFGNFVQGGIDTMYPPQAGWDASQPMPPWSEPGPLPGTPGGGEIPPPPQFNSQSFDPGAGRWYGFPETPGGQWVAQGNQPPPGLSGSWQGQTQLQTFFDPQGYPYAVPVGGWGGGEAGQGGGGGGAWGGSIGGGGYGFGGFGSAFSPGGWASGGGNPFGTGTAGGPSYWQVRSH